MTIGLDIKLSALPYQINKSTFVSRIAWIGIIIIFDKYNLGLPEDEAYNSLGGLIINHLESIPEKGEELRLPGFHLKMEAVSNSKIEIVRLRQVEEE